MIGVTAITVSERLTPDCGEIMGVRFRELYAELYSRLVSQAAFLLGDRAVAEDIAQEAFLRLHATGLAAVQHPASWLARVTNNLCFNYLRSEANRRRREETAFQRRVDTVSTTTLSPEQQVLEGEELLLIRKALGEMQPRDRMVLLLKFSGYRYDEIAVVTKLEKSSVGTILARARQRFRRAYECHAKNPPGR
ncbi:MAG: sigma-70 family RNA polymerase sigma factor [Heliobacteriaceae bacterium]|nr:sigma-70 family RNA polymerase sigma factor [Heliobacteriaceae bacterium]